jgi:hypothetical protein
MSTEKEAVSSKGEGKGSHPHTIADDVWRQFVTVVVPKMAASAWDAFPEHLKRTFGNNGVKNLFQVLSFALARVLPDHGIGPFVDSFQTELFGELRELAEHYEKGESKKPERSSEGRSEEERGKSKTLPKTRMNQILSLPREQAEKIIAWLACHGVVDSDVSSIIKFLESLTPKQLGTFALLDDAAKQVYVEARVKDPFPLLRLELELANNLIAWLYAVDNAGYPIADIINLLQELTPYELRNFAKMDDTAKQAYVELRWKLNLSRVDSKPIEKNISAWFGKAWEKVTSKLKSMDQALEMLAFANTTETARLQAALLEVSKPLTLRDYLMFWKL